MNVCVSFALLLNPFGLFIWSVSCADVDHCSSFSRADDRQPLPVNKSLDTRSTTADSLLIQNHTPALRIQPPVWSLWETGQRCSRGGMMGQEGYSTLQGAPWPHGPLLLPQSPRCRWRPTHPVTRSSSTHGGVWAPIVHLIYSASGWPNVAMPRCRRGAGLRSVSQLFRLGAKTTGELETSAPAI